MEGKREIRVFYGILFDEEQFQPFNKVNRNGDERNQLWSRSKLWMLWIDLNLVMIFEVKEFTLLSSSLFWLMFPLSLLSSTYHINNLISWPDKRDCEGFSGISLYRPRERTQWDEPMPWTVAGRSALVLQHYSELWWSTLEGQPSTPLPALDRNSLASSYCRAPNDDNALCSSFIWFFRIFIWLFTDRN